MAVGVHVKTKEVLVTYRLHSDSKQFWVVELKEFLSSSPDHPDEKRFNRVR